MTIVVSTGFESGSNGAAVTAANGKFDSFTGSATFTNASPVRGSLAMTIPAANTAYGTWTAPGMLGASAPASHCGRLYFNFTGTPSGTTQIVNSSQFSLFYSGLNGLGVGYGSNLTGFISGALTAGVWYRIEWSVNSTTIQGAYYVGDSTTSSGSNSVSAGGGSVTPLQVGRTVSGGGSVILLDEVAIGDFASGALGPSPFGQSAALAATATVSAAGALGFIRSSSLPATVTTTAAGVPARAGQAPLSVSASASAAGAVVANSKFGAGALQATVAAAAVGSVFHTVAAFYFDPPFRRETVRIRGSLQYSFNVSSTVWKDASGVWHSAETPAAETLAAALIVLAGRPQIVSNALGLELLAAGVGTATIISTS